MSLDVGDIVRLAIGYEYPQLQTAMNVFHYLASTGSGADEGTVLDSLSDNIETGLDDIKAQCHTTVSTVSAVLWVWNTALEQWDGIGSKALTTWAGTGTGDPTMAQQSQQIDCFTDTPRRQGRKFLPMMQEGSFTNGVLTATAVIAVGLLLADWEDAIVSDGVTFVPGVFNSTFGDKYYEVFEAWNGTFGISGYASTIRTRKPGVGI